MRSFVCPLMAEAVLSCFNTEGSAEGFPSQALMAAIRGLLPRIAITRFRL